MRPEPWKTSKMSGDRKKRLMQWSSARKAAADHSLPEHIRAMARSVRDKAAVILHMQDAVERVKRTPREKTSSEPHPMLLLDPPSPFAPTKELQDFIKEWEGKPEASPSLTYVLPQLKAELERRKASGEP